MRLKDIIKCELIGLDIEVIASQNPSLKGLRGAVIDESRNILTISGAAGEKKLVKSQVTIVATMQGKKVEIEGAMLVGRPEDRLKKKTEK